MAVWMEIRCDGRVDDVPLDLPDNQKCWSHENSDPMDMAGNDRASINRNATHLAKMARNGGWRFIDGEWICPGCLCRRGLKIGKQTSRRDESHYEPVKSIVKQNRISMFPEDQK